MLNSGFDIFPPGVLTGLDQLQSKFSTDCRCSFAEGIQSHRVVLRVEQAVKCGAASVHPPRHFRLGKMFLLHGGFYLAREHTFDGVRTYLLVDTFLLKPTIKR